MGHIKIFIFALIGLTWNAMAQDERYFRELYSGELASKSQAIGQDTQKKYSYYIHTPFYSLDLNSDKNDEQVVFVKKDSEDWVEIFSEKSGVREKIYSYRFETKGYDSELFRMELKKLSKDTTVLIMYYYEGVSKYIEMQGTARIYVLTIDDGDLKKMSTFKGPAFFEEHRLLKGHYHLRNYQTYLEDLTKDGVKELIVKYRNTSEVFIYNNEGKWKTFKN